jgi:protein-S-isoprenylcysteine O-methyltransferase Ste14
MSLKYKIVIRFLSMLVVFGAVFFLPAGSLRYWQGWVYTGIFFVPSLILLAYFQKHDPQVLERRSLVKERVSEQRRIMGMVYVVWLGAILLPGFDHRYGWSQMPVWCTIVSQALVLGGILMTFWVLKVNRFAARTIQVEAEQRVISEGPYRVVRHPMYLGMCVIWLFSPFALGSYWSCPVFALLIPLMVLRLLNEEKVLRHELAGYAEYCAHTHFHLVPFVW